MPKINNLEEKGGLPRAKEEHWDKELTELRERLIFLAEGLAPSRGKYEYLEERTGISAARWQNLFLRRLVPTADMILTMISYRKDKIEWLLTGQVTNHALLPQSAPEASHWSEFLEQQKYLEKKRKKTKSSETEN